MAFRELGYMRHAYVRALAGGYGRLELRVIGIPFELGYFHLNIFMRRVEIGNEFVHRVAFAAAEERPIRQVIGLAACRLRAALARTAAEKAGDYRSTEQYRHKLLHFLHPLSFS
jgi:hypothetical protein